MTTKNNPLTYTVLDLPLQAFDRADELAHAKVTHHASRADAVEAALDILAQPHGNAYYVQQARSAKWIIDGWAKGPAGNGIRAFNVEILVGTHHLGDLLDAENRRARERFESATASGKALFDIHNTAANGG